MPQQSQTAQTRTHQLQETAMPGDKTQEYSLFHTKGYSPLVTLQINKIDFEMELDTGATLHNKQANLPQIISCKIGTLVEDLQSPAKNLHEESYSKIVGRWK